MTKWEYRVEPLDEYDNLLRLQTLLNEKGQEGWELVQTEDNCAIFKRTLLEKSEYPSEE